MRRSTRSTPARVAAAERIGKQLEAELAQVSADCEQLETLLQQCFPSTKAVLKSLVGPADFAAAVREAEAARKRRFLEQGDTTSSPGFERPPPPPPPPAEEAGEAVGDGDDGDGDGDSDAGRAAPQSRAPRAGAAGGGSGGPRILSSPSGILQEVLDEMRLPHNAGRTRLLDDALVKVEHELLAVHDATRNFRPILDYLAPAQEHSRPPPGALLTWAGNPGDLEAKNVHSEFKRLAQEAEKKQREEAMREDAAAEEAKSKRGGGRSSPQRAVVCHRARARRKCPTWARPASRWEARAVEHAYSGLTEQQERPPPKQGVMCGAFDTHNACPMEWCSGIDLIVRATEEMCA